MAGGHYRRAVEGLISWRDTIEEGFTKASWRFTAAAPQHPKSAFRRWLADLGCRGDLGKHDSQAHREKNVRSGWLMVELVNSF